MIIRIFIALLFCAAMQAEESSNIQIEALDERIQALEGEKAYYEKRASIHRDRAHRYQSKKELSLDMRKEYALADKDDEQAKSIDLQIQKLQKQRKELLEKEG